MVGQPQDNASFKEKADDARKRILARIAQQDIPPADKQRIKDMFQKHTDTLTKFRMEMHDAQTSGNTYKISELHQSMNTYRLDHDAMMTRLFNPITSPVDKLHGRGSKQPAQETPQQKADRNVASAYTAARKEWEDEVRPDGLIKGGLKNIATGAGLAGTSVGLGIGLLISNLLGLQMLGTVLLTIASAFTLGAMGPMIKEQIMGPDQPVIPTTPGTSSVQHNAPVKVRPIAQAPASPNMIPTDLKIPTQYVQNTSAGNPQNLPTIQLVPGAPNAPGRP